MADEREVIIKIKSEYENKGNVDAEKGLNKVEKQAKKTTDEIKKGASSSGDSFSGLAKKVLGVASAIAIVKGAISFFTESSRAAAENARAVNTLAAAYQAIDYTANGAMKQAQDFATKMQNLTGIADEAFLNAQRLLANYGVVGVKAQEAIQSAYALSIGRSIDFATAMDVVAKAAVGNTRTLSQYGIVLGKNVEEGKKFDAVLSQINERFGATAQAAMGDTISKTNALKEAWGDFKEDVGRNFNEILNPVLDGLAWIVQAIRKVFNAFNILWAAGYDTIFTGIQGIKTAFLGLAEYALRTFEPVVKGLSYIPKIGDKIETSFNGAVNSLAKMKENAAAQTKVMAGNITPLSKIWEKEKEITEEGTKQLRLQEAEINAKNKTVEATEEELAAAKKLTEEEQKRVNAVLNNAGVGPRQTTSGWDTSTYQSQTKMGMGSMLAGTDLNETDEFLKNIEEQKYGLEDLYKRKLELLQQGNLDEQTYAEAKLELDRQYSFKTAELEAQVAKKRQATMASTLNNLASLQNSSNKKMAAVGKAAAIAQATIDTYKAANSAYSAMAGIPVVGPALAVAAAAAAIAAGLNNVAQISGIKLAEGGLVKAVSGGVNAVVGEGGSDEAVLPLDNAKAMQRIGDAIGQAGGTGKDVIINQYINITAGSGIIPDITEALRSGTVDALEFANLNYKVGREQQGLSI